MSYFESDQFDVEDITDGFHECEPGWESFGDDSPDETDLWLWAVHGEREVSE